MFRSMRKTIADILLEGVSRASFHPSIAKDVEVISVNLMAYLDGIGMHYLLSRDYFDLMEQIEYYLDRLFLVLKQPETLRSGGSDNA
jgi:hypothetical protein